MSTLLIALSTWLHTLATIVMVGYFVFTGLIFLPVLEGQMPAGDLRRLLEKVSHRLTPYFGGSLLIFLASGTYLMLVNKDYQGLGHFFSNPWSALIVIKHGLVLVFLALAAVSDRLLLPKIGAERPRALRQFHWTLALNLLVGLGILLLTALAQAFQAN